MGLFDLSLRHKLPLWSGFLILVTAVAITTSNLLLTRENVKRNMLIRSEILGRSLVRTLYTAVSQDDIWRAYEIINFVHGAEERQAGFHLENLIVVDKAERVFVSTQPKVYPIQTALSDLGPEFKQLQSQLQHSQGQLVTQESQHILLAIPLVADGLVLGSLVMVHPVDYYQGSFSQIVKRTAWTTLAVLLVLLPINWFWGRRMTLPLTLLTERMGQLAQRLPVPLPARVYPHADELGRLYQVFGQMQKEMDDREVLEKQVVQSDRLAALGRLTASIAHEINNPLGGLLTAVDTLKRHGNHDPLMDRLVPLLDRGLHQIKEIVGALLVEAKAKSRDLTQQDIDDVHTLLAQEAKKRSVSWEWQNDLGPSASLPSTLVRQVLINLVLNAVQAAGHEPGAGMAASGHVAVHILQKAGSLHMVVRNNGQPIAPELMEHLFEPFTGSNEDGHGLGLWITYQIVQQLHGAIHAKSEADGTLFEVVLPETPGDAP